MYAAVEVRVPDSRSQPAALVEQHRWIWIRFRRISQLLPDAQRPDQLTPTENVDVAEIVAPRFMPRPDHIALSPGLSRRPERVLHRGVHLPLQLQKIRHIEILGVQPPQEDVIVLARARQGAREHPCAGRPDSNPAMAARLTRTQPDPQSWLVETSAAQPELARQLAC